MKDFDRKKNRKIKKNSKLIMDWSFVVKSLLVTVNNIASLDTKLLETLLKRMVWMNMTIF